MIGYATVDGTTTGGQGGQSVTVSTLSALTSAANSSSPMIITVSGTITGTGSVVVKSNKTIIGQSGATLNGVGLRLYGVSNVIIKNLKIQNVVAATGAGDNDCINLKYTHHVWIDHVELSADRTHGWEYWDGLLDITRESNYVTVSWSKFHDSHIATLVGGGLAGHESDIGKLKITYHHNYFYNLSERAPDMKYGYVHMFNNYHVNNSGYSIAALAKGTVRTDNNYFQNCSRPITTSYNGLEAGYISGANTNTYVGSGSNNITTSASTWVPPYEYNSALNANADVPNIVMNGAGPR
jgi:pectate lyase